MQNAAQRSDSGPHMQIRLANLADVNDLTRVINAAFVVERFVFEGDRIDADGVRTFLNSGQFLVAPEAHGFAGCVYLEIRANRGYVGLLSVDPKRQGTGLGRTLMEAAEKYFREAGCTGVDLRVISPRTPLPAFYSHLGYRETGTAPFSEKLQPKVPGHYILMSKALA
jgi:GNAT superfamily N-acetyltransferase